MWTQIVGKTRLALTPLQNHWWNVTLYVTPRGLTTSPIPFRQTSFEVEFDFVGHQRGVATKQIHFAHFMRVWGNPPIHTLTVEVLDQYRALRLGEKVGPATINREMATLKHALSKAVESKLLRKTAREELAAIKKYQEPSGRLRYLSGPVEADRLLTACEESLKPIVLTALHTGMRKEELLSLTWEAVDMTHGFIRLKQTKNGTARALPFNETLWSLFSGLRTRQDVPWVFHNAEGNRWNDIRHPFERACELAGLTGRSYGFVHRVLTDAGVTLRGRGGAPRTTKN